MLAADRERLAWRSAKDRRNTCTRELFKRVLADVARDDEGRHKADFGKIRLKCRASIPIPLERRHRTKASSVGANEQPS
jgi:hypothetical protein